MLYFDSESKIHNIAEYILFMWQTQDLIRACDFDLGKIKASVISEEMEDTGMDDELMDHYEDIRDKMLSEKIERKGHLSNINEVLVELMYLHNTLLNIMKDKEYNKLYEHAQPYLKEFRAKSNSSSLNDVEVMLTALYGKLMLKLQKKPITPGTEEAMDAFREVLSHLSTQYKRMHTGELDFGMN